MAHTLGMETAELERSVKVGFSMKAGVVELLKRIAAAQTMATTQSAVLEYLIEKEATKRGIELDAKRSEEES